MELIAALRESGLLVAPQAADAIQAGWSVHVDPADVVTDDLERVYRLRLEHLLQNSQPHAVQLARSVEELLARLSMCEHRSGQWLTIVGSAKHHFLVYVCSSGSKIVACLRVVSQFDVSEQEWRELWQGAP